MCRNLQLKCADFRGIVCKFVHIVKGGIKMNKKSKAKFMVTKYAKMVVRNQVLYQPISSQQFTIAKGVRLRTFPIPIEEAVQTCGKPEITETKYTKSRLMFSIREEGIKELHDRINGRVGGK